MTRMHLYSAVITLNLSLATAVSSGETIFVDRTSEFGLAMPDNSQVACIDYDNDDWVDIYNCTTLWKNNKGSSFSKVFEEGSNAIWANFDNDGFSDLFCYSDQRLFWNDHGKGFVARTFPKLPTSSILGASWADYNGDGFVDLYVGGYENWTEGKTYPDFMILNDAGKSWKKGFSDKRYRARGITSCDFDQDGDVDIYVSNYRLQPNLLWRNDGSGKFEDIAASHNAVATWEGFAGGHSIGAAWGDFDNDGNIDLFAGNFAHDDSRGRQPHSFFLRNTGSKNDCVFQNMGQGGLHYQESYASPAVADYDNDGDLDLFFTTVYGTASFGKKNHSVLYRNDGSWKFVDVTEQCGLGKLEPTYQAGWADIDNDGDVDLITAGKLFINQGNRNNWLKIKLLGDGKIVNSDAIGSQVRIKLKDRILTRQVEAGTGQGNQNELTLHFGLGAYNEPVDVEILWAKNLSQKIKAIKLNQSMKLQFDKEKCTKQ